MKFFYCVGQSLLFLWQLPQNILGLLIYAVYCCKGNREYVQFKGRTIFIFDGFPGGVSLGNFIFIDSLEPGSWNTVRHECGHAVQSLILGPLYLIVVGIPSFVWASLRRLSKKLRSRNYYSFYTEWWADRLGGVER